MRLNSTHHFIMRINNRKELQNITINHSEDIDYKDFVKIYSECTKKPFFFLTVDTTTKMTVTDQLKVIDNKIKANQVNMI